MEEGNLHLQKLVNQFLQSLIRHWDESLVFLTESFPSNHEYITDTLFFSKYATTFSKFESNPGNVHQLIESFLELLPYPDTVNGQPRNVEEDDSWYNEFKCAIYEKHPKCTLQSLDESLSPILSCIVGKLIMMILSAYHGDDSDNDEQRKSAQNDNNNNTVENMMISLVELEDTTISWILSVFQYNLQKSVMRNKISPLLDGYHSKSMLYWSKIIGLLSISNVISDRILKLFKYYIDKEKNPQSISHPAAIYFTSMRYIYVSVATQEKWLGFFLPFLQHSHKKTPDAVLYAFFLTLLNIFKQCDFTSTQDKTIVLKLAETNELLKKLSEKKKLQRKIKSLCYCCNICFLIKSPQGLFKLLPSFLDKRSLAHLDEIEKSQQCLDMLIYLFKGTHNPFLSYYNPSALITNWRSKVRLNESQQDTRERCKRVFKAIVKKSTLKILHLKQSNWKKLIQVMTLLISQDIEYGANTFLLSTLLDAKKGNYLTMELGLDIITEIMAVNGSFLAQYQGQISKQLLDKMNNVLPLLLEECEAHIGINKLHKRETPLLIHYESRYIEKNKQVNDVAATQSFAELLLPDHKQMDEDNKQVNDEQEAKQIYDEEKALLEDIKYKQIRDAQLLSLSFLRNDVYGSKILQLRQKHRGYDDIDVSIKQNKGAKKEYLNVLRSCLRCVLSLRPNSILTDCTVKNITYIGRYLLHKDYEIVMTAYGVLYEIVRTEKYLLSNILTGLTNYLLQFYIHRASCIAILLQVISGLVDIFIETYDDAEILSDRSIVDDLCFAFNRLDALSFAFLCHTNLYVRYSCIKLVLSVERGLKLIIAHYFTDQSPEQQQKQLTFPSSLGNLFNLFSSDIIKRARKKYFSHRDNMDKTGEPFDKYFNLDYNFGVSEISHEGIIKMLLVQDDYTPFFACMDAIVEKIEDLCLRGSIYFKFLRVDSCQEILLQENWLGVDEQSRQSEILQSMCVALVSLIGFSASNGMDDNGFYDSVWKQLERFSHVNDATLVHTVLYALQSAHFTRLSFIFISLHKWYEDNFENIPAKIKKKKRKKIFQNNCVRVWLHVYVILSLTGTERLFEAFLSEIKSIDIERDEQRKKIEYLHAGLIRFCNNISTEHILSHTNSDPEVLRSVARIIENVAITLYKVYQRTKQDWILRLWSAQDRAKLLQTLSLWSQCTTQPNMQCKKIIESIKSNRKTYKDKELDRKEEKKINRRIKRIEIQSQRAATALLALGPALQPNEIINVHEKKQEDSIEEMDDLKSDYASSVYSRRSKHKPAPPPVEKKQPFTWFTWAIAAQKEGVPALKYLMKNHYALILKYVLTMLYSEQARGSFDIARIYFDVITALELPDSDEQEFDSIQILQQLVVFCLMYLVPFIPNSLIKTASPVSLHERDMASIITFRGVPLDNFGSNYAVSLPSAMDPNIINTNHRKLIGCYNRPRLLSPACVSSMGRGRYTYKNNSSKVIVELVDDIMQAIDMSRKTFKLFYKVILSMGSNIPTLDKLHELRMGLQSNDLRDVRQNASAISWVFANVCPVDLSILITDEILSTLESYAERIESLEERGQLINASAIHDQITLISNFLQVSLPWFASAPLHQRKEEKKEEFLDKILSLTLRFKHFQKPEIDNAFYSIWHVLVTSNDTVMSSPEANNIHYMIRFLVMTVCGRYQGYSDDMQKIEKMEQDAIRQQEKIKDGLIAKKKRKKKSIKKLLKKQKRENIGAEYLGPTLDELNEFRKETLKPEQFISLCESIIKHIFNTHAECVLSSLLQLISVGCGLGGHVLANDDHIQIKNAQQIYVDASYELGGPKYSLLVTEIAIRWFTSLATKSFNKIQQILPVLLVHCTLFLTRTFEDMSNVCAEFISHLFVSLLPPKLGIDDEVIQIALWLRDRRTYQFKWSQELVNNVEPEKSRMIYGELGDAFDDDMEINKPFDLRRFFARQNTVYIDDLVRILFNCYRHRYGDKGSSIWGLRALQWATVDVDKEEETTVYFARIMSARALRLFSIISQPKTLRSVTLILKSIINGLRASQEFWNNKANENEEEEKSMYDAEDIHLSMAISGIEALVSIVRTDDWNRTLFRMMLVSFWIALTLLKCRIARVQIAARRLLRTTLQHRPWLVYLFGQAKDANGANLKKGSISLEMFWSFFKLFEDNFNGIQERIISALIFTIGDDSPVTLNTDIMMILCCVWLIRCDALHDVNIESRLAANLSFFLPYACTLLTGNYFESHNIDQHTTGHREEDNKEEDKEEDNMEKEEDKELRDKTDAVYRLRKENARIFKTLALYIQQNVIKEEKGVNNKIRLSDIDINDMSALSQYASPAWSKINIHFRQTYIGIYDVVSHIATALMASWTMDEPSTLLALGDFCQYLIDVFIPSNAATLSNVFSICLLIGDEYLKIGTIKALQLFVPRLFKQCRTMNIFDQVIGCFDETFERCTNLTSDLNENVSTIAHNFVLELTKKGYRASGKESALMNKMYPAFTKVDLFDDGMISTLDGLHKILDKTNELLVTYPDNQAMDNKLYRLLNMKPRDHIGVNKPPQQPLQSQPRRQSQMPGPHVQKQRIINKEKQQLSFIQKREEPMQHSSFNDVPPRLAIKPQRSILAEDEENDEYMVPAYEMKEDKPYGARHRELLSTVTVVSNVNDEHMAPNIMNMGSYRELKNERTVTVEKLESIVDKQLLKSQENGIDEEFDDMQHVGKYNQFGSDVKEEEKKEANVNKPPPSNPNALPYGMKDNRSSYIQQAAARANQVGHKKTPTFGAAQLNDAANLDYDSGEEEEEEPEAAKSQPSFQQFPKMENVSSNYMPGAPHMDKDYDPFGNEPEMEHKKSLSVVVHDVAPAQDMSGEGGADGDGDGGVAVADAPGDVASFDIPPMHMEAAEESEPESNVPVGDLSTFLDDTTLLRTFLKFLKKKTDDYKLLEFYLMAGQFKTYAQDPKSTRAAQRNNAKLIIETFFLPDSKKFLEKIQGMTRHEAMSQFLTAGKSTDLNPMLFDKSKQEVKGELISRVFPIFMQSDRYKKLVNEGKVRPP